MKARGWMVVAAVMLSSLLAPGARAADPAVLAKAGFGLVGGPHHGYVAIFTVRKSFTAATAELDLISEVFRCTFADGDCSVVSQQLDVLPAGAFVARADLTARLSTKWAGKPLRITWGRGGRGSLPSQDRTVMFVGTNHQELLEDYRALNAIATASAMLGGSRGCADPLGITATAATLALGSDVLVRVNDRPRAESVPGLAAARGRCYIERWQPAPVRALLRAEAGGR